jgi:hypothetical protein
MSSIDKELADPKITFEGRLATFVATRGIPALSEDQIKAVKRRIDFFESAIALLSARLKGGANTEQAFKQLDTYIRHDYFTASDTANNMTAEQLASANRFVQFIIRKQAETLKGIYTPIVISPEMKRWMNNGIIPADNAIPERAPAADEFASDTIPLPILENNPFSAEALNNKLRETRQKIENDSPIVLHLFIEDDLNSTLAKLAAKIESLKTPDMTEEAISLKAGYLIEHVQSLEALKRVAQAKIAKALNIGEGEEAYPMIEYIVIGDDGSSEEPIPSPKVIELSDLPVLTDVITDPLQMNKIIKQSVKIQKAVETLTGDALFQLRKNVIGPLYQEALIEIDAKRNHQTAIPHLSKIEPEDLLKHADFLKGQLKIADTKIQVETVLKAKAQDVRVITDAVILTPAKAAAPAAPEDREIDLTSRLSGWIRKSWSKASNSVRAAVAGTVGLGVATLATAFALSAKNAPEAPEAPIAAPIAVTAVTSAPTIIEPVAPVAVAEPAVAEDVKVTAPEPVKAKAVNLAKKSFTPAVTVVESKPIIEKSFDIAEFSPDLMSLVKACKQAGEVKVGGVCESIKSYEMK